MMSERARIAASTNRKASSDCRCWALQPAGPALQRNEHLAHDQELRNFKKSSVRLVPPGCARPVPTSPKSNEGDHMVESWHTVPCASVSYAVTCILYRLQVCGTNACRSTPRISGGRGGGSASSGPGPLLSLNRNNRAASRQQRILGRLQSYCSAGFVVGKERP